MDVFVFVIVCGESSCAYYIVCVFHTLSLSLFLSLPTYVYSYIEGFLCNIRVRMVALHIYFAGGVLLLLLLNKL